MSVFIPGNTMVENVRALATSALPDAPVEPDEARSPRRVTALLGRLVNRRRRAEPCDAEPTEGHDTVDGAGGTWRPAW